MTLTLIHMIGAITLLLWSATLVRKGITRALGAKLQNIIATATKNRFTAFLSGIGVTILLQSSTATTLVTTSFLKKSMMTLGAALAIVIGADLATTLVAQILSFDLSALAPALIAIGVIIQMKNPHGGPPKHVGNTLIGLGLMLISLMLLKTATAPLKDAETLPLILAPLAQEPIIAILVSALLTWLFHSSLAAILLFASLATQGIISPMMGLSMVLGANLGGAMISYVATYAEGLRTQRLTLANIAMRVTTLLLCLPFLPIIAEHLSALDPAPARMLINAHTGFNIALAIIFLPLTHITARGMLKLFPERKRERTAADPLYLDENALDKPTMALAGAARETLRLADLIEGMTKHAFEALKNGDINLIRQTRRDDNTADDIYKNIKLYLTRLQHESLTRKETLQYDQILSFATNLEHCGDMIEHSLADTVMKKINTAENFSEQGWEEIKSFYETVIKNMNAAQSIFMSQSLQLASELIEKKRELKQIEFDSRRNHFNRLSQRLDASMATSSIHLDLMRDLGRINSYVTSVAYSVQNADLETRDKGI